MRQAARRCSRSASSSAARVVISRPGGVPRVSVLDVGQGDAILVEGSRGGRLLIDGGPGSGAAAGRPRCADPAVGPAHRRRDPHPPARGPRRRARAAARPISRPTGVRAGHARTRAGLRGLAVATDRPARAPVRLGLARRRPADGRRHRPSRAVADPRAGPGGAARRRDRDQQRLDRAAGRASVRIGCLLAGDVEQAIDPSLLEQRLPRLDLLKVAHHGSRTATTQAFVDAVRPKVAVASAGAGNPYGHPARATLDRLAGGGRPRVPDRSRRHGRGDASVPPG